ncbi:ImmA/IrrE family metallo-endopeptidase [Acinetobacter schindleri]|uniref:ImmA/IrrE family metallo-endopeptidase n=1 Tax=Acinetobacter schindleri TaxID=108981 RepID=UPI00160D6751|nr:XRE family transcriptional regulator [Acinetobacter schindleri]MBB4834922.1 Zn-dependent peptidase ImmA (M78 family) [Acinetobacter schindleri]WBX36748.1 XRE family transcriptional regulator [Acinetobacter schindleri]
MKVQLVRHSITALQRYMADMNLSADELARLSKIADSKIIKALNEEGPVLKLTQLEKIAKILFVPTVYLTTDQYVFKRDTPDLVEHRNKFDISENKYKYRALIEEFSQVRQNYISIKEALDEDISEFKLKLSGNIQQAEQDAETIVEYFGFRNYKKKIKNNDDYYNSWRQLVEDKDIIVLDRGAEKFGSDGMCMYYKIFPVITIFSSGQYSSRKLFTLIHEIVHLGLGQSVFDGRMMESQQEIERYCDRVAGYVLAPKDIIEKHFDEELPLDDIVQLIRKDTKASKAAIAIQLKTLGYIGNKDLSEYLEYIKPKNDGIPNNKKENTVLRYFGYNYVEKVLSAMWQEQISSSTAKSILGFRKESNRESFKHLQEKVF